MFKKLKNLQKSTLTSRVVDFLGFLEYLLWKTYITVDSLSILEEIAKKELDEHFHRTHAEN